MGVRILACPSFNNQILTTNQYACQYSKPVTVTIHPCSRSSFKVSSTKDAFDSLYLPRPGPPGCSFRLFGCLDRVWGLGLGVQNPPPSLAPRKRKWIPFLGGQARAGRERARGGQKNWLSGCRREKTRARGKLGLPPPLSRHSSALYPHPRLPSPPFSSVHSPSTSPL
jgi:hypothetical protein